MLVELIDSTTCYIICGDENVKLYVRRGGLERLIGFSHMIQYKVRWTLLKSNAEIFTHENAKLAISETWEKFVSNELVF